MVLQKFWLEEWFKQPVSGRTFLHPSRNPAHATGSKRTGKRERSLKKGKPAQLTKGFGT